MFAHKWTPGKYVHFPIQERGKVRPISAPKIQDRQVHKTLTRGALMPLYLPDMIHENGASLPGKGFHFGLGILADDLREHFRRYGREGCIILMDYTQFFPSASHKAIYARHDKLLRHPNIKEVANKIVQTVPGERGLPLGVEVSQMEMVALPSPVDNYIKCQLHLKGASHYMDDYAILVPPDKDPNEILEKVVEKAAQYGLTVSLAKTRICPLTKPFRYCKAKFTLTETGRVIINGNRKSMPRSRHKFKALKRMYDNGERTFEDVRTSIQGSIAYFENYNDHNRVLKLRRFVHALFGFRLDNRHNIIKEDDTTCDMWFSNALGTNAYAGT